MPSTKNFGRQYVLGFEQVLSYDDFPNAQAGVAQTIKIALPPDAILMSAFMTGEVAFAGLGTPTIAVGDSVSAAKFLAATAPPAPGAVVALPLVGGVKQTLPIQFTLAGTGTATAGSVRVSGTYIQKDRANDVME